MSAQHPLRLCQVRGREPRSVPRARTLNAVATIPRLDFPIRMSADGTRLATVEQDTVGDWAACVQMAALTNLGAFSPQPDFGTEDYTFSELPIGEDRIRDALLRSEPRAELMVREAPDEFDQLVSKVTVIVGGAGV